MKYDNITRGIFLKRSNRFIAEVEISGHKEIVHVKNTGRCRELLIPGCEVFLTMAKKADRKTRYDLVTVKKSNGVLFNIDSQAPNKAVKEWLEGQAYSRVIPEYTYGRSRIDFYMERDSGSQSAEPERYLMEVKGCTLEKEGIGYFPDAPTERGVKHIHELIEAKKAGYHVILAFVIQMDGVSEVRANVETHPEFGEALAEAGKAGVEIWFFECHVEPDLLQIIRSSAEKKAENEKQKMKSKNKQSGAGRRCKSGSRRRKS